MSFIHPIVVQPLPTQRVVCVDLQYIHMCYIIAQDAPLSTAAEAAAAEKAGRGVSYTYSSLDKRHDADGNGSGKGEGGPGDKKAGGLGSHAYAPLFENRDGGDGGGDNSDVMAGMEGGGVIRLTSRHHIAIPISYFCIGFLGRCVYL